MHALDNGRNKLEDFAQWVIENKEWLFSGAGLAIASWLGRIIYRRKQEVSTQEMSSGNDSINIQAGRDISNVNTPKRNNVEKR